MLVVISGPSGVGKGTIVKRLRERFPEIKLSISVTTRAPRTGERDGIDYFFRTEEQFKAMIERGELLEYACFVNGCLYGTPRSFVEEQVNAGHDVILEIDVKGAMQVKDCWQDGAFVFILPPSLPELKHRLQNRKTETEEAINQRISIATAEIQHLPQFDYQVINDDLDVAVDKLAAILTAEHCRVSRNQPYLKEDSNGAQQIAQ